METLIYEKIKKMVAMTDAISKKFENILKTVTNNVNNDTACSINMDSCRLGQNKMETYKIFLICFLRPISRKSESVLSIAGLFLYQIGLPHLPILFSKCFGSTQINMFMPVTYNYFVFIYFYYIVVLLLCSMYSRM